MNITNISSYANTVKSVEWSAMVNQVCDSWANYSTLSHNTYIWIVGVIIALGLVKTFIFKKDIVFKIELSEKPAMEWTIYTLEYLRDIAIGVLVVRIIQVWYIINFVL